MRKTFLLPLKFLVFFIISAAVFSLFVMIFNWGQNFSRASGDGNSLILFFSAAAGNIILPSVSSALLFTAFDYRKNALGILHLLLLAVSVFVVLFFGLKFAAALEEPSDRLSFQPFESENIHDLNDALIYTGTTGQDSEGLIKDIVVRKHGSRLPGFRYYAEGSFQPSPAPLLVPDGSAGIGVIPKNPVYSQVFRAPELFSSFLRDVGFCNSEFKAAAGRGGRDFLILTAAFSAFFVICLLFKGISAWPLFEMILILFFHRIVYYVVTLFAGEADFISQTFLGGAPVSSIPLLTIVAMSVLLLLCGVLLRTSNRMRKK